MNWNGSRTGSKPRESASGHAAVMTVEEVDATRGCSRNSVCSAIRRGELPSLKVGRRVLVPVAPLRELLGMGPGSLAA